MKQRQRLSRATLRLFLPGFLVRWRYRSLLAPLRHAQMNCANLLESGKLDEAYRVTKTTPEELGNPAYDFYFGVAAVNSGEASDGALSLAESECDLRNTRRGHRAHSGCCGIQTPIDTVHF